MEIKFRIDDNFSMFSQGSKDDMPLLICFGANAGRFNFINTTKGFDCHKFYTKDLSKAWYHRGMPQLCNDITGVVDYIKTVVAAINPSKLIMVGSSSGAYMAILMGWILQADKVIAFCPQTNLSQHFRNLIGDNRWEHLYKNVPQDGKYLDLLQHIKSQQNDKTKIKILYAKGYYLDMIYAAYVQCNPQIEVSAIEIYSGGTFENDWQHNLAARLSKHQLTAMIHEALYA